MAKKPPEETPTFKAGDRVMSNGLGEMTAGTLATIEEDEDGLYVADLVGDFPIIRFDPAHFERVPPLVDPATHNQETAELTDKLVASALAVALASRGNAGAVMGGAVVALVRFCVEHLIQPPAVPTLKGVFELLTPPVTIAAANFTTRPSNPDK